MCCYSNCLPPQLCDCVMKKHITGSDHCPLVLFLATRTLVWENETWQYDNKMTLYFLSFHCCTLYLQVDTWPSYMDYKVHNNTLWNGSYQLHISLSKYCILSVRLTVIPCGITMSQIKWTRIQNFHREIWRSWQDTFLWGIILLCYSTVTTVS